MRTSAQPLTEVRRPEIRSGRRRVSARVSHPFSVARASTRFADAKRRRDPPVPARRGVRRPPESRGPVSKSQKRGYASQMNSGNSAPPNAASGTRGIPFRLLTSRVEIVLVVGDDGARLVGDELLRLAKHVLRLVSSVSARVVEQNLVEARVLVDRVVPGRFGVVLERQHDVGGGAHVHPDEERGVFIQTLPQYPSEATRFTWRSRPIFFASACTREAHVDRATADLGRYHLGRGDSGALQVELRLVEVVLAHRQPLAVHCIGGADRVIVAHYALPLDERAHHALTPAQVLEREHEVGVVAGMAVEHRHDLGWWRRTPLKPIPLRPPPRPA